MSVWPQYLVLGYWFTRFGLMTGVWLADYTGRPSSPGERLVGWLISLPLTAFVLWKGGFFSSIGWSP